MTNPLKNLKNDPAFSLTESERALMRARLLEVARATPTSVPSPFIFIFHMRAVSLAVLLIVSTTGVSFAAEGALPGETLYPIKLSVNERIEFALAPGTEAKATVAVRHAEERIREVEVLAAEGNLDEEQAEQAAKLVEESVETVSERALALYEEGDTSGARSIHARLDATLAAHTELLDAQAENLDEDSARRVRTLSFAVTRVAEGASAEEGENTAREETNDDEVRTYARATYARAEDRIRELGERIEKDGIPEESIAELLEEHARLSGEFSMNEELFVAEDDVNATVAYSSLERRAVRALTFLKAAQDISDETDMEAVITLNEPVAASMPVASARAKSAAPALMMTTTLSLEAATTTEDATTLSEEVEVQDTVEEQMLLAPEPRLRFWLRDQSRD